MAKKRTPAKPGKKQAKAAAKTETPPPDLKITVAVNKPQGLLAILVDPPSPQIVFSKASALEFAENIKRMASDL